MSKMANAWLEAAKDLGVRFLSPHQFRDSSGRRFTCAGLLPDFGGAKGALILSREDEDLESALEAGDEAGYYVSGLSPHYYESYRRELFKDTLNDWGWFNSTKDPPSWFTGDVFRVSRSGKVVIRKPGSTPDRRVARRRPTRA